MKRRRIRPRTDIPDWRDSNMPVLRQYTMRDGTKREVVDPDYERRYREFMVSDPNHRYPNWCDDPTYYGRKEQCQTNPNPASRVTPQPTADIDEMLRAALEKLCSR